MTIYRVVADNDADDKEKTVLDEFMLAEYDTIAEAHFDAQKALREQFKFYLLIAAVPLTVMSFIVKERTGSSNPDITLFSLPALLATVFIGIGILGILMFASMVQSSLNTTLYARTVNGVRGYFMHRGKRLGFQSPEHFLLLPGTMSTPSFFDRGSFLSQGLLVALINTAYIGFGISSLTSRPRTAILSGVAAVVAQASLYYLLTRRRQNRVERLAQGKV